MSSELEIRSLTCSSCGAPLPQEGGICEYCQTPFEIIQPPTSEWEELSPWEQFRESFEIAIQQPETIIFLTYLTALVTFYLSSENFQQHPLLYEGLVLIPGALAILYELSPKYRQVMEKRLNPNHH